MATVSHWFGPFDAVPPGSSYPIIDVVGGTNFPVPSLKFAAGVQNTTYLFFRASAYGSGNLTIDIDWYADTASSGNVVWECAIAAITPDTDSQDIETKSFATINYVQDTHLGTTGQRLHRATVTISNLDSLAADDWVCLKLARDGDSTNATDNMSGYAQVVGVRLSYSDT